MTRYPRQIERKYLSCRSRSLNKNEKVYRCTLDLHQGLVACDRRLRYFVEYQLPTVFQHSDSFHVSFSLSLTNRSPRARARWPATLDRIRKGRVVKPLDDFSVFEEEHACAMPSCDLE